MLNAEDAAKLLALLARVQIQGNEAPEFMRLVGEVQKIAQSGQPGQANAALGGQELVPAPNAPVGNA